MHLIIIIIYDAKRTHTHTNTYTQQTTITYCMYNKVLRSKKTPIVMHNNNSSNKETKKISASAHSLSSYSAPFFLKRSLVTLFLLLFTIHIGNVIPGHEGREDGHNHFLLHFGNVFGKGVDTGADLARHWNGILGIGQILLFRATVAYQIVVDCTRFDAIDQVDDYPRVGDGRILLKETKINRLVNIHESIKTRSHWRHLTLRRNERC